MDEDRAAVCLMFAHLGALAKALLTVPNSYATPERTFSMVKIFTEQRSQLGNSTLSALLKCKLNEDTICTEFAPCECGWRVSRARHTTCALARHRSECEFYLEHFVVSICCMYIYVICTFQAVFNIYIYQYIIVSSFEYFWHGIFILLISIALFNSIIL